MQHGRSGWRARLDAALLAARLGRGGARATPCCAPSSCGRGCGTRCSGWRPPWRCRGRWRTGARLPGAEQEAALERVPGRGPDAGLRAGRGAAAALCPVPGGGRRALARVEPAPPARWTGGPWRGWWTRCCGCTRPGRHGPGGGAAPRASLPRLHRVAGAAGSRGGGALLARRAGRASPRPRPCRRDRPRGGPRRAACGTRGWTRLLRGGARRRGWRTLARRAAGHAEHRAAGRVGAAALPLRRGGGRRLRHHRLRAARRSWRAWRRWWGCSSTPFPCGCALPGRRAAGRVAGRSCSARRPGARARVRAAGGGAGVERGAAGHAALREPLHLRELPRGARRGRRGRVGPAAGDRRERARGVDQLSRSPSSWRPAEPAAARRWRTTSSRFDAAARRSGCWSTCSGLLEQVAADVDAPVAHLDAHRRTRERPAGGGRVEPHGSPVPRGRDASTALFAARAAGAAGRPGPGVGGRAA